MRKNLPRRAEVAIIGGSGLESLLSQSSPKILVETPYGSPPPISIWKIDGHPVAFLPRHGYKHELLPHRINYRANIYGLYKLGARWIIATNSVGAINLKFKVGDLIVPHDLIDFTKKRPLTFLEGSTEAHVDFTEPYCNDLRRAIIDSAKKSRIPIHEYGVYACMEGPRYETAAEVKMLKHLGCDVVGMTGMPEAILARELKMCYASICYVSNMAAGIGGSINHQMVVEAASSVMPRLKNLLIQTILRLYESGLSSMAAGEK